MSAETLRSFRIILLKATHWPFVALILGYEQWRLYLNSHHHPGSSLRGPNTPGSHRRSAAGRPALSRRLTSQLATETRSARKRWSRSRPSASIETDDDLRAAVAALQTQVETLSAMLAKKNAVESASG